MQDGQDGAWELPNPAPLGEEDRLLAEGTTLREMLEDVQIELLAWMFKLSAETNVINPAAGESWLNAETDIKRTLAAQGCVLTQCEVHSRAIRLTSSRTDETFHAMRRTALTDPILL